MTPERTGALLDSIRTGGVFEATKAAAELRRRPSASSERSALLELLELGDVLGRLTAGYALSRRPGAEVDRALLTLLGSEEVSLRETAALAFSERDLFSPAIRALRRTRAEGGFAGMLAELALEEWSRPFERASEAPQDGMLSGRATGLRVAQVFLQGRIDGGLNDAGAGDGGGLATLVVHLSQALGRRVEIDHAFTITRAFRDEHARASQHRLHEPIGSNASIERVPFGPDGYLATADMWPHRAEIERGLERTLRRLLPVDVVHLRFADVGTFAAARVCRRLGIPVCFTLAADPHVVIRAAERAGTLDRATFADMNGREHYLLRAHLVESMLEQAEGLVLFPRENGETDLVDLLGIDPQSSQRRRFRTVSEGISLQAIDEAARACSTDPEPAVWGNLRAAIDCLPSERAGLPLLLSVGRYHRVKGFDRLLEAWAGDPTLFAAFNLVLVGGNLKHPTGEEATVVRALREVEQRHPHASASLIQLGHRSHDEVTQLLHAARFGIGGAVAPNGVYACASDKEEFGLALLEALAVGLTVVAPQTGGPATYIRDGVTGILADTTSIDDLRRGLDSASALRNDQARAATAAALVRSRFSVDAMAAELTSVYLELAEPGRLEVAA